MKIGLRVYFENFGNEEDRLLRLEEEKEYVAPIGKDDEWSSGTPSPPARALFFMLPRQTTG